MNSADFYMKELIHRILDDGYKDVNPRPKYADGTPAHTFSVNHEFRSYDLSAGDFPTRHLPAAQRKGRCRLYSRDGWYRRSGDEDVLR